MTTPTSFQIHTYAEAFQESFVRVAQKEADTYSSIMRSLNKDDDHDAMTSFQITFKQTFDAAYVAGEEYPEVIALNKAKTELNEKTAELKAMIVKTAAAIELGDADSAGHYLAELVKFLLKRISQDKRPKAIQSMKRKIYYINEFQIASRRTPPSSSMGQSISLIKTLLLEHNPTYIRQVLLGIIKYL
jgi:hypothetical protein